MHIISLCRPHKILNSGRLRPHQHTALCSGDAARAHRSGAQWGTGQRQNPEEECETMIQLTMLTVCTGPDQKGACVQKLSASVLIIIGERAAGKAMNSCLYIFCCCCEVQ